MGPKIWWKKRTKWHTKVSNPWRKEEMIAMTSGCNNKTTNALPFHPKVRLSRWGLHDCVSSEHLPSPAEAQEMAVMPRAIQSLLAWCIIHEEVRTQVETRLGKNDQNSAFFFFNLKKALLWFIFGCDRQHKGNIIPKGHQSNARLAQ